MDCPAPTASAKRGAGRPPKVAARVHLSGDAPPDPRPVAYTVAMAKGLGIVWAHGALAVVGGFLVAASIVWQWGHTGFGAGAALLTFGLGATLAVLIPRPLVGWVAALTVATLVAGGSVVLVKGLERPPTEAWDLPPGAAGVSEVSGIAGDVIVTGGRALRMDTGEEVWSLGDDDAETLLVTPDVAVVGSDGRSTIALEPASGKELWRFPAYGQGIAYDRGTLVLATADEAVGLDIRTGETVWTQPGMATMECDGGPTSRFSPAKAQAALFLSTDDGAEARAVHTADGSTLLGDVNCRQRAFVAP